MEWFGFGVVALGLIERSQIVEAVGYIGVFSTERLFPDSQRAFVERFGFGVVALAFIEYSQIVEAGGYIGVFSTKSLFPDR